MPEPALFVHQAILNKIVRLPGRPWEVGGWLLGYWDRDDEQVMVTHATPPSRGTPLKIQISGHKHRRYFDQAWESSDGEVTFLGDWHTHPGGRPDPSNKDAEAMEQLASEPRYGTATPLMLIAGTARWPRQNVEASFGFYVRERGKLIALQPRVTSSLPGPTSRVPDWPWPGQKTRKRLCLGYGDDERRQRRSGE